MAHESASDPAWRTVTTPFDVDLRDVVQASAGPVAVGGGGTVVANRGDGWETVVASGPAEQNRTLSAVAVTDDGKRVWYAGASGAIGTYDVAADEGYDRSYSKDLSPTWSAIAVDGRAGTERVTVADTSGRVLPIALSGREPTYGAPATLGGGTEITALATGPDGTVYATDTGGSVYATTPSGWTRAGIEGAQASLRDVAVGPNGRVYVAAANGTLYERGPDERRWRADQVAGTTLRAVDALDGHVVVLSANDVAYRRPIDGRTRWHRSDLPTGRDLLAVALDRPDVAVGKAGTVVTRPRTEPPAEPTPADPPATDRRVCELLRAELIGRLDRTELLAVLDRHETCDGRLAELLAELRSERREGRLRDGALADAREGRLVVLPVAAGEGTAGERTGECRGCECRPGASGALERLLCE